MLNKMYATIASYFKKSEPIEEKTLYGEFFKKGTSLEEALTLFPDNKSISRLIENRCTVSGLVDELIKNPKNKELRRELEQILPKKTLGIATDKYYFEKHTIAGLLAGASVGAAGVTSWQYIGLGSLAFVFGGLAISLYPCARAVFEEGYEYSKIDRLDSALLRILPVYTMANELEQREKETTAKVADSIAALKESTAELASLRETAEERTDIVQRLGREADSFKETCRRLERAIEQNSAGAKQITAKGKKSSFIDTIYEMLLAGSQPRINYQDIWFQLPNTTVIHIKQGYTRF